VPPDFSNTPLCSPIIVPSNKYENFRKDVTVPANPLPGFKAVIDTDATSATRLKERDPANVSGFFNPLMHSFIIYQFPSLLRYYLPPTGGLPLYMDLGATQMVLEYKDTSNNWHTYNTLAGNTAITLSGIGATGPQGKSTYIQITPSSPFVQQAAGGTLAVKNEQQMPVMKIDPRTARLGLGQCIFHVETRAPYPGAYRSPSGLRYHSPFDSFPWIAFGGVGLYPGKWVEGNKTAANFTTAQGFVDSTNIADPDTIVRPADAWLDGTNANLYRKSDDDNNRPVILQRPFRSVGELGYVFRDSPWKTLNFFDQTSGDAGMLDFFSIADEPSIGAGHSNLNTTQTAVNQALLTGAAQAAEGTSPLLQPGTLASQINSFTYSSGLPNPAALASIMGAVPLSIPLSGTTTLDGIKYRREAVVRSLSNTTQTRTWNLLIDVVAQSGRYPANTSKLENFIVEGEKRFWLSIAIDRYTGKILDQQLEPAND
jgi:hypothetical protein